MLCIMSGICLKKYTVWNLSGACERPLCCCIQLWGPRYRKDMDPLEQIQRKGTEVVIELGQ